MIDQLQGLSKQVQIPLQNLALHKSIERQELHTCQHAFIDNAVTS